MQPVRCGLTASCTLLHHPPLPCPALACLAYKAHTQLVTMYLAVKTRWRAVNPCACGLTVETHSAGPGCAASLISQWGLMDLDVPQSLPTM